MDFFSLPHQKQAAFTEDEDGATESFAKAIDDRFNNPAPIPSTSTHNLPLPLSLALSAIPRNNHLPSPHISSRSHSHHFPTPSPDAALFTAVTPADLPGFLSDPHTLILDIRPLPAYLASRVPHALPLSVPSTLLKRPLFPTARLAEMLPTPSARRKFSEWRLAKRILVYDADSAILPEGNNVLGLLRKFRSESGLSADPRSSGAPTASPRELQLNWLTGGFQAVFREKQSLLDHNFATNDDDDDDDANRPTLLRTKHLPMSAFTVGSTTSQHPAPARTESVSKPSLSGATVAPQPTSEPGPSVAFNPFYDTIRQNFELSHGITERIPLKISRIAKDRIEDLPFSWLRELGRWAGEDDEGSDGEDHFGGDSGSGSGSGISGAEGSEALAMQFYRIELGEQRRLMGVMEHHSRESGRIMEGGEKKGNKSKYRNIWPFEHARLPLNTPAFPTSTDDYVNASYVQPLGTKRRYIATQGPLPETFKDFWLLVWEQNVHVIVMLTREVEGSTIKCGNYWSDEKFGPLRLKLLEVTGAMDEYEKSDRRVPGDPFFPYVSKTPMAHPETGSGNGESSSPPSTVKRVLELSHTGFPHLSSRRIVQFQYLDWPDLNVPSDTGGILELIREVEYEIGLSPSGSGSRSSDSGTSSPSLDVIDRDTGIMKHALGERPVLLHCSAGVGRTGGFIAIDAVLDGIRREMRKRREGFPFTGGPWGDNQISKSRSGRDIGKRAGHTSGSSTSEKDRTSSGDEVAAMDVDEASAGGSAPPVPGLVMKLPAEDNKAVVHVPVVGMISPASSDPSGKDGAVASMVDDATSFAAISPWAASVARNKLQAWNPRTQQSEPLSSPSSSSARDSRPSAPSGESVKSAVPQTLSRSLSPSGDSSRSDISALSLPLSVSSTRSFSPSGPDANSISLQHHKFSSLASAVGGANLPIRTSSAPTSGKSGSKSSESPPANEDSPPDPYYSRSQSQSQSEQHSPPAFDYTRPRRLHDDRHSPALLSTLDEPIHRVIEDMREQRMSLCQSLRQYVFVHRAVIEGVLMLVDEERTAYGKAWKDNELEDLSKSVLARFPNISTKQAATSEGGSIEWAADASHMEMSPTKVKRRASPTELPKEDRRGDMRMSKRPSIKRALRSSDEDD
ncbi:hypothetical protein DFH94DRAFT_648925, partial [Russula ochroleuca]